MKKYKILTFLIANMFFAQAFAIDFVFTKGFFNKYAINGYDTVNYFTEGKPAEGNKKFTFEYKGAKWKFKNAENLELFKANPQKYAPQYGGHCAWRMAIDGVGVYGNPNFWTIVDNKLYLNYNKSINQLWTKDIPNFIVKADDFWLGKNKFKTLN
jgi:YHS domain-containing protein